MAVVTRTTNVDLDAWFFNDGATNYGNGKGSRMVAGRTTLGTLTGSNRFAIHLTRGTLFDGVASAGAITQFQVKARVKGGCDGSGGAIHLALLLATSAAAEQNASDDCGVTTAGTGGTSKWPSPGYDASHMLTYSGAPADNDWVTIDGLAFGQWWYAHPEITDLWLIGVAYNAAFTATDEANHANRISLYTRHTTSVPYAQMQFNDDVAPDAPSSPMPPDNSKVASTAGTTATVSAVHTQTEGQASTQYQAQAFPAGTTDAQANAGSVLPTKDNTVSATTANGASRSHTFTGLASRTSYEWRIRFARNGAWGPWLALQTVTTAYQPATPQQVSVTPNTLTPDIGASISTANDPLDTVSAMQAIVYQDQVSGGTVTKWDSGKQAIGGAPTRGVLTYGGTALQFGQQYRLQVQLWNRDDIPSGFTANIFFTPLEAVGAAMTIGGFSIDLSRLIQTTAPTVRLSRPGGGNIDEAHLQVWSEDKSTILYDSGLVGPFAAAAFRDIAVPAGLLAAGSQPWFSGAIRNSGDANIGPYSALTQGRINAVPGSPLLSVTTAGAVVRSDGVVVVDAASPTVLAVNRDTDLDLGYADPVSRSEFEVRTLADAHYGASPYVDAAVPINTSQALPALVNETTYKVRARYDDSAAQRSAFSDYLYVRRSSSPTLSAVTPAAAAALTVPRATVQWTYNSGGGKQQAGYQLVWRNGSTVLYDSGYVAHAVASGATDSHTLPSGTLPNGITVANGSWTLVVYDSDGLSVTLTRTFSTNFAAPPALTGLTVVPADDGLSLDISWNVSGLTDPEFVRYRLQARAGAGEWADIQSIYTKATTTWRYRKAHLNTEEVIRLTQDNGYAESTPLEVSGEVDADGTWRIGPDLQPMRLRYVQPSSHTYPNAVQDAEYAPLGSDYKSVVTIGQWGVDGSLTLEVPPDDWAVIQTLRDDRRLGRVVIFKTWRGLSVYAKVREVTPTDIDAGRTRLQVRYTEVDPALAAF